MPRFNQPPPRAPTDPESVYQDYLAQKHNAAQRGVDHFLSFQQYFTVQDDAGHLHERGCGKGQFVLHRKRDFGAYEIGNIEVIRHEENVRRAHRGRKHERLSPTHVWLMRAFHRGGASNAELAEYFGVARITASRCCHYLQHADVLLFGEQPRPLVSAGWNAIGIEVLAKTRRSANRLKREMELSETPPGTHRPARREPRGDGKRVRLVPR